MAQAKKSVSNDTLFDFLIAEIKNWPVSDQLSMKDREVFIKELLQGESLKDLQKRPVEEAIETVKKLWDVFQQRRFEDIYINLEEDSYGQADRLDITIMQRQIPFITDSILNLLRQSHIFVTVLLNATIKVRRDDDGNLLSIHPDDDHGPDLQIDKILHLQCEHRGEELNLATIREDISNILRDVHAAVEDWRPMQGQIVDTINELEQAPATIDKEEAYETAQFLTFLKDGNFTFLGYREHDVRLGKKSHSFDTVNDKSLGLLRDKEFLLFDGLIADELIPAEVQNILVNPHPTMMVLKANRLATVHRNVQLDVIIVKRYDAEGKVISLRLFSGLFTALCYARPVEQIPYLSRKVTSVLNKSGYEQDTHAWRSLRHVLDSYSRDELFQIDVDQLYNQAIGINRLNNRPDIEVFIRKDSLERYFSVFLFLPKDQYNTSLRMQIQAILEDELKGKAVAHFMTVDEKPLARLQYMISCGTPLLPEFDLARVRQRLIDTCTPWFDRLKIAALSKFDKHQTQTLLHSLSSAFSVSYKDQVSVEHALDDLNPIQKVLRERDMVITLNRYADDEENIYRIKFYKRDEEARLSELLPMLDRMGFHCLHEYSYAFNTGYDLPVVWMHELVGTIDDFKPEMLEATKPTFAEAFEYIWRGKVDSDSFNSLVLAAGLTWREANLFRAFARYLDLANYSLGKRYIGQVLAKYSIITQRLKDLFLTKMNPELDAEKSELAVAGLHVEIDHLLDGVEKLDEDRVLRSILNIINNILRTNYFHKDDDGFSLDQLVFKLNAQEIKDLPKPRPYREMYVYGKRFEAVHLRGGPIARGGIRWSDRYEDFRTEILGLMKAQMVKNAVIVPVGAKGGFICKNQPGLKTPQERQAEGIACYKLMVESYLSITDNLVNDAVVPPANTLRLDGDDPYLVVAADKGTASFSDIANGISLAHNFWLGDAFASGGSVGYDHKEIGITARGAWECIKRHFRELGKDIQTEEFTVAGVGDMSGDVFGNGMLLSEKIRLVAAFDHRHIFIDPNPDVAASYAERKRMFELPTSSWMDFNTSIISKGGAIFSRQEKSVTLTPEIKALLDIETDRITPNDLMQAILKANVELLYFGGIGTYIKSSYQSHEQVGDKGNDGLRVNGNELRCKVVGEGANLGATQAGRIEFAQHGGKVDTDFIDNSGGVDTSDHEVNIKILLQPLVNGGKLPLEKRNVILEEMTDDVAAQVLKNNYDQSLALSLQELRGSENFAAHVDFMRTMERQGLIDRRLEGLPDDDHIQQLMQRHQGLTRPELCVLLPYSKISLLNLLLDSSLPDDPEMLPELVDYFPDTLQEKFKDDIPNHKLKREIIATQIANMVVNRMGLVFVNETMARTGLSVDHIVRCWMIVRSVFDLRTLWAETNNLDNKIPADLQLNLYQQLVDVMEQGVNWFLQHHADDLSFTTLIPMYRDQLIQLQSVLPDIVPAGIQEEISQIEAQLASYDAIRSDIKKRFMQLPLLLAGCDVAYLTQQSKTVPTDVAKIYFTLNERLHLAAVTRQLETLPAETPWAQEVIETLQSELQTVGTDLTMQFIKEGKSVDQIPDWLAARQTTLDSVDSVIKDMERIGTADLALLTVIVQRLRRLVYQNEGS
jgi:glutamate dehydrogenase